jgi:hypothetical protein
MTQPLHERWEREAARRSSTRLPRRTSAPMRRCRTSSPGHHTDLIERDGIEMAFHGIHRPLEAYFAALRAAGLAVEQLQEPAPTRAGHRRLPDLAKARRRPAFLHWLALRR